MSILNEESCLLAINSNNAVYRNNGTFTVNIGNTTFAEHVNSVVPIQAKITNIFPNVKQDYDIGFNKGAGLVTNTLTQGQYSLSALATALQTAIAEPGVNVTITSDSKIQIDHAIADDIEVFIPGPLAVQLGFTGDPTVEYTVDLPGPSSTVVASHLPALEGVQTVYIECDRMASSNLVHSKNGKLADIVFCIPLHDTPYGMSKTFTVSDVHTFSIQLKNSKSISSTMTFRILDHDLEELSYSPNQHIHMLFKIHHSEHRQGGRQ